MALFFRKKEGEREEAIGFEPEEQKTPWLGRILLVILAVVLLYFGWVGLSDLGRIPDRPERLSRCSGLEFYKGRIEKIEAERYFNIQYTEYDYQTQSQKLAVCVFSSYEVKSGVPDAYKDAQLIWKEKNDIELTELQKLQTQLSEITAQISQKQREYDLSLQEIQAGRPPVGKTSDQLRQELQSLRQQQQQTDQQLLAVNARIRLLEDQLKEKESILVQKLNQAIELYNKAWAGYKFWVFLLEMLFVLPFFAASLWFYFRLLRKNSPHTIILLPVVFVGAILVARSLILYFWASFLADLIEILLRLSGALVIFRVLLFYVGMLLAIVIFGGAVFLLQRKIFAPVRVRLRRLKSKKCPHCEAPMDFARNFCVACGSRLLEKCSSCGQDKYIDFKFCPYCGK